VLDVGTGGGEKFLQLASCMGKGLSIDIHPGQIAVARSNITEEYVDRISFEVGDGAALPVENETFDVVLNRHAGDVHRELLIVQKHLIVDIGGSLEPGFNRE
jgi:ubiquinone/menaquinone biosynthesis C-methylase UbiE